VDVDDHRRAIRRSRDVRAHRLRPSPPAAPLDVRRGRHAGRHVSANLFLIAGLVVVILFPGITTWLPGVFGMR
jgi:hypothetical protein